MRIAKNELLAGIPVLNCAINLSIASNVLK